MFLDMGYFERGLDDQRHCLQLEPRYENCTSIMEPGLIATGQFEEAERNLQQYLEETTDSWPVSMLYAYSVGNRTAALAIGRSVPGWEEAPLKELLALLDDPSRDAAPVARLWREYAQDRGLILEYCPELLAALGEYDGLYTEYGESGWWWQPIFADYRRSEPFRQGVVRKTGMLEYWQANGFPPMCRPAGDDDFECD